ncbi:hypothetical protein [Vibrio sp. SCSIO 43136]|uniref:hypothetical protein n=1 Tax=Vibrio sp. SCSIO 43136 TaxID=2819101 RepID=UPI002075E2A1|nr:hypothetical protein [Vibrio sp. SCSIO 43136]USD66924.1 hypothetical protein J4N39_19960 [Vibrio sp. SCSIO 43136]
MKRASASYRLQMIKEVATRQQRLACGDPMASHIQHLIDEKSETGQEIVEKTSRFNGLHYDEQAGGWISDRW